MTKEKIKPITYHSIYDETDSVTINNEFRSKFSERFETLTMKEKKLFRQIYGKSGVLYIQGKPGIAKSAKMRSIAMKMGMLYIDFRLSMVDETDVGMFPDLVTKVVNGISMKFLEHVPPMWAFDANQVPTLIHFEELNRASLHVRNAAMQILLERAVGTKFTFNKNVYMVCSGNLGDEDMTDVEELDSALNGRLIHNKYSLSVNEWLEDFAIANVHPVIVRYIQINGDQLYPTMKNNDEKAYASPRSWTFLSDYIKENFCLDADGNVKTKLDGSVEWVDLDTFIGYVSEISHEYIGSAAARKFNQYMQDQLTVTIEDILNRYGSVRNDVKTANQSRWADWMHSLKEKNITDLTDKQIPNVIEFLKDASREQLVSYLTHTVDKNVNIKNPNFLKIAGAFKEIYRNIHGINAEMQNSK